MSFKQFDLPEIGTVKLYKRRGTKGLRISIGATSGIRVTLPMWLPYKTGLDFALSRREWILKNQPKRVSELTHGKRIGKAHELRFYPSASSARVSSRLLQNEARVIHPIDMPHMDAKLQQAAKRIAVKALTKEAEALLPSRLAELAKKRGFTYKSVQIKRLSSRWGSCSAEKDITLNCFLMQLPWDLIDYVLLHELLHTEVLRHGPSFWSELDKHVANLAAVRKTMRTYQPAFIH